MEKKKRKFPSRDKVRPCPKRLGRAGCIRRIVWGWENDLIRPRFARPPSPGGGRHMPCLRPYATKVAAGARGLHPSAGRTTSSGFASLGHLSQGEGASLAAGRTRRRWQGGAGCIRRATQGWENDLIRPRFARPPSPGEGASLAAGRTRRRWRLGRAGCIRRPGERPHPTSLRSATFPRGGRRMPCRFYKKWPSAENRKGPEP